MSQAKFADLIGVNQGTVHKYEKGISSPSDESLKKIAEYGDVTVKWLLHGDQEAPSGEIIVCKADSQLSDPAPKISQTQSPEPLEAHLLYQVMAAVEDFLNTSREKITLPQHARLITKIYNECSANFLLPDRDLVEKYCPLDKYPSD